MDKKQLARQRQERKALKEARQDGLREHIRAKHCVTRIMNLAKDFEEQYAELTREQIAAKRAEADLHFRLLNKVLPDLKAMEVDNKSEGNVVFNVSWFQDEQNKPRTIEGDAKRVN